MLLFYAGENGSLPIGSTLYDVGALGVQVLDSPGTSVAYTGTSFIPRWWQEWVHETGGEYGTLVQMLAEQQLGLDPATVQKDPMGFRSRWQLPEFNRAALYQHTFGACVAPLVNSELYARPPEDLSRETIARRLTDVREYVANQQSVPTVPIDRSRVLFVTGSNNAAKYAGTQSALEKLQQRDIIGRIAHTQMLANQPERGFQLAATPVSLGRDADQPRTPEVIVANAKKRAQQALDRYPRALAAIGEQGGILEIGDRQFEAHYVHAMNDSGLAGGEWTVFFPLPEWFVHQVDENQTQASHLAMVYGGLGSDPISLFSQGLHYNRPQTIELATMGALLPHAYPELHSPYPL